jgi:hypothetical protein
MKRENAALLSQLISSLEETFQKLERAYQEKNAEEFDKLKKLFLQIQEKINGVANE